MIKAIVFLSRFRLNCQTACDFFSVLMVFWPKRAALITLMTLRKVCNFQNGKKIAFSEGKLHHL